MVESVRSHPLHTVDCAATATATATAKAAPPATRAANSRAGHTSTVPTLIGLAHDLAQQGPPVDEVRIAQIRQAIDNKIYAIDVNAIAAAIVHTGSAKGASQ
jgi:anti-sigma28 factor (negative regulator of flagellin synthesis)